MSRTPMSASAADADGTADGPPARQFHEYQRPFYWHDDSEGAACEVQFRVPPGTSSKRVSVVVEKSKDGLGSVLRAGLRGAAPIIAGRLMGPVDADVQWTMESDRGIVTVPLEKREPAHWPLLIIDDDESAEMDPYSAFELGLTLERGLPPFVPPDPRRALPLYRRASQHGVVAATFILAQVLRSPERARSCGLPDADVAEGIALLREAAENSHPGALYVLGECFRDGDGVERDLAAAEHCWRPLADQEPPAKGAAPPPRAPEACFALSKLYGSQCAPDAPKPLLGNLSAQDHAALAMHYLELAAAYRHPRAYFDLGMHHMKNARDLQMARVLFARAHQLDSSLEEPPELQAAFDAEEKRQLVLQNAKDTWNTVAGVVAVAGVAIFAAYSIYKRLQS